MEMNDHLHVPATLPPEETTRRLYVSQSRSGRFGEEKYILPLLEIEPRYLSCPACSLAAVPTGYPASLNDLK
jgi:hypothetical protein